MALTPNDVLNKQFATTRLKEGYDQDEVDDFLDEVLAEFQRLIGENETLRTQVTATPAPAANADSGEVDSLRSQLDAARQQVAELQVELTQTKEQAESGALDGMNSAEYLQLARRVHEEHVREGVVKRDQLIAEGEQQAAALTDEARNKADSVVVDAQKRASSLINEAQAAANAETAEAEQKAAELVDEAQRRYDSQVVMLKQQVDGLTASKSSLEGSITELQEFERTYRTSLRDFLEGQLGELESVGAQSAVEAPAMEGSAEVPEPPVPGLGEDTGEQPAAPRFGY